MIYANSIGKVVILHTSQSLNRRDAKSPAAQSLQTHSSALSDITLCVSNLCLGNVFFKQLCLPVIVRFFSFLYWNWNQDSKGDGGVGALE